MSKLKHLGIIADGNRRWAKEHGLPKIEGHRRGFDRIEGLVMAANEAGIPFISFYVFSTENWGRAEEEVSYLMKLAENMLTNLAKKFAKANIRMLVLGARKRVDPLL